METLDLTQHGPEDFEGKLISYKSCSYVVGPFIATGATKIVFQLINLRSGLCHYVVKFWRSAEMAAAYSINELASKSLANAFGFDETIPDLIEVQGHGGFFELQGYMGPYEAETSRTHSIMQVADDLVIQGHLGEAISSYEQVLQMNAFHTVALHNLAYAQAQLGDVDSAFISEWRVLEIEPNWRPYQAAYIRYAASNGQPRAAITQFEATKAQFAYHRSDDELAINLYLASGRPEKAQDLLESSILDRARHDALRERVASDLIAKGQATKIVKQAKEYILLDKLIGVLELLEKAYSTYNRDPFNAINLGFALLREGDYQRAKKLLLSTISIVPINVVTLCLANAAFAEILSSNLVGAMKLLDGTINTLMRETNNEDPTDLRMLPSVTIWIDEKGTLEESPDSALNLINHAVGQLSKEQVPDSVRHLVLLYKRAVRN